MAQIVTGFTGSVDQVEDAIRSSYQGAAVPVVQTRAALEVTPNTVGTRLVNVAGGVSWAHGVRAAFDPGTLAFDAVTADRQTRWDAAVIRRDWTSRTATLIVVKGTPAVNAPKVLPAGLNDAPGSVHDQVLALVQLTFGSTSTVVEDRRLRAHKTVAVPSVAALPPATLQLYGMEATVGNLRYRCDVDSTGKAAWMSVGSSYTELTQSDVLESAAGWSGGNLSIRGLYDAATGEVQIDLQERRTGDAIVAAAGSGNFPDTPICTFKAPFRPDQTIPVFGQYAGGVNYVWVPFTAGLGPSGLLTLQSGAPNVSLSHRSGSGTNGAVLADDISLRALIRFTRKV